MQIASSVKGLNFIQEKTWFLIPIEGGGLGGPGQVRGRVTVGLAKGNQSGGPLHRGTQSVSCQCIHSGVESSRVRLVAYCRVRQETHGRRILSCPPSQEPPWAIRTVRRRTHSSVSSRGNRQGDLTNLRGIPSEHVTRKNTPKSISKSKQRYWQYNALKYFFIFLSTHCTNMW